MIITKFGVPIPPWRKDIKGQPLILQFVITGLIPSTKNRQRASFNYSWAISQVRQFFKTQTKQSITVAGTVKFIVKLIRDIRPFIYKPEAIVKWEEDTKQLILDQAKYYHGIYAAHGLSYPLTHVQINIRHYWADDYQRDNSNREQTIHDLLVTAGIVADDNYKCLFKNVSEAQLHKGEINDHITVVVVSAYRW